MSQIIQIDETKVWKHLDSVVRQIVEETLLEMYLARE